LAICCLAGQARADASLVYETLGTDGSQTRYTFAISGRFVRVDSDTEPARFRLIDTGLLTMADVDVENKRYTFEKLPRRQVSGAGPGTGSKPGGSKVNKQDGEKAGGNADESAAAAGPELLPLPVLSPTRKKQNVSGVVCRLVRELVDGQPVAEHCMAGTGPFGITGREMITLSRLFTTARRLQLGWAGVATADERIASVDSKLGDGAGSQTLLSISYDWIPDERMRVSKQYRRVQSLDAATDAPGTSQAATVSTP
jgi:hypothetical protein